MVLFGVVKECPSVDVEMPVLKVQASAVGNLILQIDIYLRILVLGHSPAVDE